MPQKVSPHWGWLLLAPVILIVGVVGFIVLLAGGTMSIAEGMQRVNVPGEGEVTFEQPGEYTIFYEQTGVMQAQIPTGLRVEVTPPGADEPLKHILPGGKFTYNNNDVAGRNFGRIDVPKAGTYHVRTSVGEGVRANGRVAIGGDPSGKLVGTIFGSMGLLFGSIFLTLVYVVVIVVLRVRNRRKLPPPNYQQSNQPQQPYGSGESYQ